jgi:purine-binding chemotaxis protein CheW
MTGLANSPAAGELHGVVSMRVGDQIFGAPVLEVQDVITPTAINVVPLAPPEVAGSLNLRGRIVTAIDMRCRLGVAPRASGDAFMCVIVERMGELYALLVDDVGDVLWLSGSTFEPLPVTLPGGWRALCDGLYRLDGELLLALDVGQVLTLGAHPTTPAPISSH